MPWWSFFALVGGLFLLIIVVGVGLDFLSDRVSLRAALVAREQSVLLGEVGDLETRNAHLGERVAVLERAQQIDREAYGQLQRSYLQRENEIAAMREELAFYHNVVDPKERNDDLRVTVTALKPQNDKRRFLFEFIVSQAPTKRYHKREGDVDFRVIGVSGGQATTLGKEAFTLAEGERLTYSFKFYQTFRGVLSLPAGFVPDEVVITVTESGRKNPETERRIPWSTLLSSAASRG
ncbi:MAG: hypothetical protein KDI42_01125, partial [Gammaproteobacteria bacterium]|nr:hypothetical protein [Gammaproteobacteria bacterium]